VPVLVFAFVPEGASDDGQLGHDQPPTAVLADPGSACRRDALTAEAIVST
jgi:hypothetical protein